MKSLRHIALCCTLMLLAGCHSGRNAQSSGSYTPAKGEYAHIPEQISLQTPAQRVYCMAETYGTWKDVQTDMRVSVSRPASLSFSAKAYMKRGEWISVSCRLLGFEVASLWVDKDSIHVLDKYHKYYISESLRSLTRGADVTVTDLQDLLLGRAFTLGGGTLAGAKAPECVTFTATPQGLILLPKSQSKGFEYGFIMAADANRLSAASISVPDKADITFSYADFATASICGSFAGNCAVEAQKAGENAAALKATLSWNPASAKWNSGLKRSWSRPSGYSRISAERLASVLKNL